MKIGKVFLVFGIGLFMALAALNNALTLGDAPFSANGAVSFAVGMQETGQHPNLMWRAIDSPFLIWLAVFCIILTEAVAAVLCIWGAYKLWAARSSTTDFNDSKSMAIQGLSLIAVFYLLAFQAVVGEWFMVWQTGAPTLDEAFKTFAMAILILIWVNTVDE
jgi:predicted small integral membrane protein